MQAERTIAMAVVPPTKLGSMVLMYDSWHCTRLAIMDSAGAAP
jgi:hypothetical protein